MKALTPYLFPIVVILIVLFLLFRWSQEQRSLNKPSEGITIDNLSEAELQDVLTGVGDYETIELETVGPEQGESEASETQGADEDANPSQGQRRLPGLNRLLGLLKYEIEGERLRLSLTAQPEPTEGGEAASPEARPVYVVWFKRPGEAAAQRGFALSEGKGGLMGTGSLSVSTLPLEVYVTQGDEWRADQASVVLKGELSKPAESVL